MNSSQALSALSKIPWRACLNGILRMDFRYGVLDVGMAQVSSEDTKEEGK